MTPTLYIEVNDMTNNSVFLDYALPSLNNLLKWAHSMKGARMKKEYLGRIEADLKKYGCVPERMYDVICVSFLYGESAKRRDPDNVAAGAAKYVLDAMVNVGIIPDDSRNHVLEINHNFTGAIQATRAVHVSWHSGWLEPE